MQTISRTLIAAGILAGAIAGPGGTARAAIVNYSFSGVFDTLFGSNATLQSLNGTAYSVTLAYDTTVADINAQPDIGWYPQSLPFTVQTLLKTFNFTGLLVRVDNDLGAPFFDFMRFDSAPDADDFLGVLVLRDTTQAVFQDDSLPGAVPPLSSFDRAEFSLWHMPVVPGLGRQVDATLNDDFFVDAVNVPEPAMLSLLGAGLFGLGAARRGGRARRGQVACVHGDGLGLAESRRCAVA